MSIPCKFERSILSYDEHEIVLRVTISCAVTIPKTTMPGLMTLRRCASVCAICEIRNARWPARTAGPRAGRERREAEAFPAQLSNPCSANKRSLPRSNE